MQAATVILGAVILLFGRRLFWLFVGVAGFLAGVEVAAVVLAEQPQWMIVAAAVLAGLVGVVLAIFLQRLAFALAGLLAGVYLALVVTTLLETPADYDAIWLLAGGLLGALLAVVIMDRAIIVLSSLLGSVAIAGAIDLEPVELSAVTCLVLFLTGAIVQWRAFERQRERKAHT